MESERQTRHQMARAHRLAAVITALPGTPRIRLDFAQNLTRQDWVDKIAVVADRNSDQSGGPSVRFADRPPSETTIAMAIALIAAEVPADCPFGNFR